MKTIIVIGRFIKFYPNLEDEASPTGILSFKGIYAGRYINKIVLKFDQNPRLEVGGEYIFHLSLIDVTESVIIAKPIKWKEL